MSRPVDTLERRWRLVPFRARLTLGFAGAMIILFGGLALLLHVIVESSLDQQIDRSLQARSADLASLVDSRHLSRGLPALPDSDGTFAQIIGARSGQVLAATSGHAAALISPRQRREAARGSLLIARGPARLRAGPVATDPPSVLVVGVSLTQRNHTLLILSDLLFVGGPLLLGLTCLAGYILAARALAPVEQMSRRAATISGAPAGSRLPVPAAHDEIRNLGETLNDLLARVEEALARERAFVADASHELRTPLTVLKLELEFALNSDSSREELQERVRSASEEVDRLTKIAQDLLLIARADQGRLPLERRELDVGALLADVRERLAPAASLWDRKVVAEMLPEPLTLAADPSWAVQALANLVTNALRHGRGTVTLTALCQGSEVELHVRDSGDGFDPAFLGCAFERFARLDPARSGLGAGLGLAIVRAIAAAHGGSAGAANRPGGGADVWISLPRSSPRATAPSSVPSASSPPRSTV